MRPKPERIAAEKRMFARAKMVAKKRNMDASEEEVNQFATMFKNHLKDCSCFHCGNVRRTQKRKKDQISIQEKKFQQKEDET